MSFTAYHVFIPNLIMSSNTKKRKHEEGLIVDPLTFEYITTRLLKLIDPDMKIDQLAVQKLQSIVEMEVYRGPLRDAVIRANENNTRPNSNNIRGAIQTYSQYYPEEADVWQFFELLEKQMKKPVPP